MKLSLIFSLLTLVWSIYNLATNPTSGGVLTWDLLINGSILLVSAASIGLHIYRYFKNS